MTERQKTIYLVRHGQTESNACGRLAGSTDQPLTPLGLSQAKDLAAWFAWRLLPCPADDRSVSCPKSTMLCPKPTMLCLSSPLLRAKQTARAVASLLGLEVEIDEDLAEMDFGVWEGRAVAEILAEDPHAFERCWAPSDDTCFPGGESLGAFEERIRRALGRILACKEEIVLVFSHGGVVRAAACALLGLGREFMWRLKVEPATVLSCEIYGGNAILSGLWNISDCSVTAAENLLVRGTGPAGNFAS